MCVAVQGRLSVWKYRGAYVSAAKQAISDDVGGAESPTGVQVVPAFFKSRSIGGCWKVLTYYLARAASEKTLKLFPVLT